MSLAQTIRRDRVHQNRKQPCARSVFNTVACLVKTHGLADDFLDLPEAREKIPDNRSLLSTGPRPKQPLDLSPFVLLPQPQYRLTMAIIDRWDGPYLQFAHTPEEILLSRLLHDANPSLAPKDLLQWDFETLLRCESARREFAELEAGLESTENPLTCDRSTQGHEAAPLCSQDPRERIARLRAFIVEVLSMESAAQ